MSMPEMQPYVDAQSRAIDWPTCPQCETLMRLVKTEFSEPKYENQTLECPECGHKEELAIKYK